MYTHNFPAEPYEQNKTVSGRSGIPQSPFFRVDSSGSIRKSGSCAGKAYAYRRELLSTSTSTVLLLHSPLCPSIHSSRRCVKQNSGERERESRFASSELREKEQRALAAFAPTHGETGQTGQDKEKAPLVFGFPGARIGVPDTARRAWKKRRRSRVRRGTGPDGGANGTRATY